VGVIKVDQHVTCRYYEGSLWNRINTYVVQNNQDINTIDLDPNMVIEERWPQLVEELKEVQQLMG